MILRSCDFWNIQFVILYLFQNMGAITKIIIIEIVKIILILW